MAVDLDAACGGLSCTGKDFQQRTLSRSINSDDTYSFTRLNVEIDVL